MTQRDLARRAGVSSATVSRALRGDPLISEAVRAKILAISEEMGYSPNLVAQALRMQSTKTVGIVIPRLSNPFFSRLVETIEGALDTVGYGLMIADSRDDGDTEARRIRMLMARQVDGLLIIPCDVGASAAAVKEAAESVPVVQVDRAVRAQSTDHVEVDCERGIALAIDHLRENGRHHIAFISAKESIGGAAKRLHGFQGAVGTAGGPVLLGDFSHQWGKAAVQQLLSAARVPDAIVCGNDLIAFGVLEGLSAAGRLVPDEVAITGFDNIPFTALTNPPLTSVNQPVEEIAASAVSLLTDRIADPTRPPRRVSVTPTLTIRSSTTRPSWIGCLRNPG